MAAISGISAAMGALNSALEQFDRALLTTVTAVNDPGGMATGPAELPDGLAGLDTARLAAQAALVAANASISMLDEVIKMGEYSGKDDAESSPSHQQQSSAPSRNDSAGTVQLMAYAQLLQSAEPSEPASPPPASEEALAQSSAQTE